MSGVRAGVPDASSQVMPVVITLCKFFAIYGLNA